MSTLCRKFRLYAFTLCALTGNFIYAQVDAQAPQIGMVESDPYANYFQRRTPAMDFLLSQIQNPGDEIKYDIGQIQGSPYENASFTKGDLLYKGKLLKSLFYRYNSYSDEIEIKETLLPEEEYKALIKDFDLTLVSDKATYTLRTFKKDKKEATGYFKLIEGGTYSVFTHTYTKYKEGKPAANSMVNPIPSRFTTYIDYFLSGPSIKLTYIEKKKDIPKTFSNEKQKIIKNLIKDNNLNFKNESDFISLVKLLNSQKL